MAHLRDVGSRLEYVLSRYVRLVADVAEAADAAMPDLNGRLDLINSELGYLARRLQDLLLLQHEDGNVTRGHGRPSRSEARQMSGCKVAMG